ncbi:MAG: HAD family hydrolase [Solirubrobacteraceae bacterium]
MSLRAILFDLDDTLVPERPALQAGFAAVAQRVWGAATPERITDLMEAARTVWRAGAPAEYRVRVHLSLSEGLHGDLTAAGAEADAMRAFLPTLHAEAFEAVLPPEARGSSPELVALWRTARMAALRRYPETLEALQRWSARLPVALVTNGASRLQRDKLAVTSIDSYFTLVVASEEVGIGKPAPAIFEAALAGLGGLSPDDVVMVGNDRDRDLAGARNARIRPILIDRQRTAPADDVIATLTDLEELLGGSPPLADRAG